MMTDAQIKTDNIENLKQFLLSLLAQGKAEEMVDIVIQIIQKLQDETAQQAKMIRWLQQKPFRSTSEVVNYLQGSLFPETAANPAEKPDQPSHEQVDNSQAKKKEKNGGGRQKLPEDLPRNEHIIEVSEEDMICPECQAKKKLIGYETSEVLNYIPGHFEVDVYKREKRVCTNCEEGLSVAPVANKLIEKGIPGIGLMSEIIVSKYRDHLPLYRLERRFEQQGVSISRSSMSSWIQMTTENFLSSLRSRLKTLMLKSYIVQGDETTIKVLDRNHPKNIRLGYYWFYVGDHKIVYIDFTRNRSREGPIGILKERKSGYFQTDGYTGYERLYNGMEASLTNIGCWMHARRYFYRAYEEKDYRALPVLKRIKRLYEIEKELRGQDEETHLLKRQEQSHAEINEIQEWLKENADSIPPKTRLGKAITYMSNQWKSLVEFLKDSRVPLDNGGVERAIRPVALGRKNYLFAGSIRGAENAAVIYSLLAGCALNKIKADEYFNDILNKLVNYWPASRIDELLPHRWKELHA